MSTAEENNGEKVFVLELMAVVQCNLVHDVSVDLYPASHLPSRPR
jgi:hypothetical protein